MSLMTMKNEQSLRDEQPHFLFTHKDANKIKYGHIWLANLKFSAGGSGGQGDGFRYLYICSNDIGNRYSGTVVALNITTQSKPKLPTHVEITFPLPRTSIIMAEQIVTLDKIRLEKHIGRVSNEIIQKVNQALRVSLNIYEYH